MVRDTLVNLTRLLELIYTSDNFDFWREERQIARVKLEPPTVPLDFKNGNIAERALVCELVIGHILVPLGVPGPSVQVVHEHGLAPHVS